VFMHRNRRTQTIDEVGAVQPIPPFDLTFFQLFFFVDMWSPLLYILSYVRLQEWLENFKTLTIVLLAVAHTLFSCKIF
jgi:hypothetical protein